MSGLASLVLADARFPGGGHVHSGGLEEAVDRGLVSDVDSLAAFLRGRLRTAGRIAACAAAVAAHRAGAHLPSPHERTLRGAPSHEGSVRDAGPGGALGASAPANPHAPSHERAVRGAPSHEGSVRGERGGVTGGVTAGVTAGWAELDAALDARTPSAAQREASRAQGRAALRAVRAAWPSPVLDAVVAAHRRPHHPLLAGAVIGFSGEDPAAAARCVGYLAVTGPASAAVRLLGLDPFAVNAAVVAAGPDLDAITREAADLAAGPAAGLPAPGAPMLDLMAEAHVRHHRERVRLFAS